MRDLLIFGAVVLGVLVLTPGCATRGSVKVLEGQAEEHAQRIDTDSGRIDAVGQRVEAFGQRVDDLDGRVGRLSNHHHAASVVSTLELRFASGRSDLDDAGMTRLHALAKELRDDRRANIEMVGYADASGSRDYNVQLSQWRVEAVRRYLVQQGVEVSRIAAIGLGPLVERGIPDAQKRRVTVHVTMPEIVNGIVSSWTIGAAASDTARSTESN